MPDAQAPGQSSAAQTISAVDSAGVQAAARTVSDPGSGPVRRHSASSGLADGAAGEAGGEGVADQALVRRAGRLGLGEGHRRGHLRLVQRLGGDGRGHQGADPSQISTVPSSARATSISTSSGGGVRSRTVTAASGSTSWARCPLVQPPLPEAGGPQNRAGTRKDSVTAAP